MKPNRTHPESSALLVFDSFDKEATQAAAHWPDAMVLQTLLHADASGSSTPARCLLGDAAQVRATMEYAFTLRGVRRVVLLVGANDVMPMASALAAPLAALYRALVNDPLVDHLLRREHVEVTGLALVNGQAALRWSPGDASFGDVVSSTDRPPHSWPSLRLVTPADHPGPG